MANVVHLMIIIGFGLAAIVLPALILSFRYSVASVALCGMIWFVLAAGMLATSSDYRGHLDLDYLDVLRIGAVACFLVFVLAYDRRGRPPGGG